MWSIIAVYWIYPLHLEVLGDMSTCMGRECKAWSSVWHSAAWWRVYILFSTGSASGDHAVPDGGLRRQLGHVRHRALGFQSLGTSWVTLAQEIIERYEWTLLYFVPRSELPCVLCWRAVRLL